MELTKAALLWPTYEGGSGPTTHFVQKCTGTRATTPPWGESSRGEAPPCLAA